MQLFSTQRQRLPTLLVGQRLGLGRPEKHGKNWHHAIAQYDGTTRSLWYDGEMVTSDKPAKGVHNTQMENAGIGITAKGRSNEFFAGMLDDVRVYNRALFHQRVKRLVDGKIQK